MRAMKKAAAAVLCAFLLASCSTLTPMEKNLIEELDARGLAVPKEEYKRPSAAGALNLLPGFGNFYLAYGTREGGQWVYGLVNMALWPLSIAWSVPEAYIDASTLNKKLTVDYYVFGPGRDEIKDTLESFEPSPEVPKRVKTSPSRMLDSTSTY